MANRVNYALTFAGLLDETYEAGLLSSALGQENDKVRFFGANTIKFPTVKTGGYSEHKRSGGWNRKDVENDWETKTLSHDRDVEFLVDAMDVDETSEAVGAANVTGAFLREHAMPEMDCFRFSKLYAEYLQAGETADVTVLTAENVLNVFDEMCRKMTENEVKEDGRILYVTPTVYRLIKSAAGITRALNVQAGSGLVDRRVTALDNVTVIEVPSGRMKTAYDFTDGCKPAANAKQLNMILVHPEAVIAPIKHSAINFFAPGDHTQGDGYLYQNRVYTDLFVLKNKAAGVQINVEA